MVNIEDDKYVIVDTKDADVVFIELFAAEILSDTVANPLLMELAKEADTVFIFEKTDAETTVNEPLKVSIVAAAEAELLFIDSYTKIKLDDKAEFIEAEFAANN